MPKKKTKKKPLRVSDKQFPKVRNWTAVHAHFRKAGHHGDKKKQDSKTACRGKQDDQ